MRNKEQFLKTITNESYIKSYTTIFNNLSSLEQELSKPFEEFNSDELQFVLDKVIIKNSKSINACCVRLSLFRRYCDYIGIDFNYGRSDICRLIEKDYNYISYDKLKDFLDTTVENVYDKTIFLLIHLLIPMEDIGLIKVEDIDFISNEIKVKNKIYKFNDYTKDILDKAVAKEYNLRITEHGDVQEIENINLSSSYLLKTRMMKTTNNGLDNLSYIGVYKKVVKYKEVNLTDLKNSAIVDKIIETEKENNIKLTTRDVSRWLKANGLSASIYDIYTLKNRIK